MTGPNVAGPISTSEFEMYVLSRPYFDAAGLLVATDDTTNEITGFTHCGFGPAEAATFCRCLDKSMGTIAVVCAGADESLQNALIQAGIKFLKSQGAGVIYAGGRYPLNPFYWGLYGGSEFSGVLESEPGLHASLVRNGFAESARSVLFEFNLAGAEPRHMKNTILKRESRLSILEDDSLGCLWTELAIEPFHPMNIEINGRLGKAKLASAVLWPMLLYGRRECRSRIGLISVDVAPEHRRQGYGRLVVTEAIKCSMELSYDVLCVQTDATNHAAIQLYEGIGFKRTESASLYRLCGP